MKKYIFIILICFVASLNAISATFTNSSTTPSGGGIVGNYDVIVVKFSQAIKPNPTTSTSPSFIGTIDINGIKAYSRKNNFYTTSSGAIISNLVKINPNDNTELLISLVNCVFDNSDPVSITIGAKSVYSVSTPADYNSAINLSFIAGDGTVGLLLPLHNGSLYSANDTLVVGCGANVYLSGNPSAFIEILENGLSVFKMNSEDFSIGNYGITENNKLKIYGFNSFQNAASYSVSIDPGFLITYIANPEAFPDQEGVPLNNWIFTANFVTATSYLPAPNSLNISNTTPLNITFNQGVQIGIGNVEIRRHSDNFLFETVPSTALSLINSNQTLVIPHAQLGNGVKYYITIGSTLIKSSSTPAKFGGISNKDTWSFTTDILKTWIGGTSSDWNTSTNWSGNTVPATNASVMVSNGTYPCILNSPSTVNLRNLTIASDAKLTISNGATITLIGDFTMLSAVNPDTLTMSKNSSCIINGTLNVDPSKVYIHTNATTDTDYSYIYSSPVASTNGAAMGVTATISKYNNPTASYVTVPPSENWEVGRGYSARLSKEMVFTGSINSASSYDLVVKQTPGTPNSSYNLLGNPYLAALPWASVVDLAKVYPTVWIWSGYKWVIINSLTSSVTGSNDPSDLTIPRGHGFFVRAVDNFDGTLTVSKSSLVNNNNSHLKSATISSEAIRLTVLNGKMKDDILIGFSPEAQNGFEFYDSEKRNYPDKVNSKFVQIASFADGYSKGLAINTKVKYEDNMTYKIELVANTPGTYDLELTDIHPNLEADLDVLLVDSVSPTNIKITPMMAGDKYSFTTLAKVDPTRFKLNLVVKNATNITPTAKMNTALVFYSSSNINISLTNDNLQRIEVYNINGSKVFSQEVQGTKATIPFEGSGVYVVKVTGDKSSSSHKIVVTR